ncbi:MAG TPA: hypothetical protein VIQ30_01625 [Pseudonocardia sp.]
MSGYLEMSEEEQYRVIEETTQRALDEPMPNDLRDQIADLIEPHTINARIKHADVMDCISVAFPVIRDYLRQHPDEAGDNT